MTFLSTWRRNRNDAPTLWPFGRPWGDLGHLFDRGPGFPSWGMSETPGNGGWMPAVDVCDRDTEITVCAELPGLKADDIDIYVSGNVLHISGKREEETEDTQSDYYLRERRFGSFARSIELPPDAEPDRIRAEYHDGELIVHVPKSEQRRPRHIPIEASAGGPTSVRPSSTEVKPTTGVSGRPHEAAATGERKY